MSYLLPVYTVFFFGLALAFVLFSLSRSDEARPRKWARVRVWVDEDNRKQRRMPPNDDLDSDPRQDWWIFPVVLLLIFIILEAAS